MIGSLLTMVLAASPWLLPEGATAERLLEGGHAGEVRFAVSPSGEVLLHRGDTLAPLSPRRQLSPVKLKGGAVDAVTFLADGSLVALRGRRLAVMTATADARAGLTPAEGTRLASGTAPDLWMFAADTLWRLKPGGKPEKIFVSAAPIDAAASDGTRTVISTASALLEVLADGKARIIAPLRAPATSVALGPDGLVFFGGDRTVGVAFDGREYPLRSTGGAVQTSQDALFVFLPSEGLFRIAPLASLSGLEPLLLEAEARLESPK